MPSTLVVKLRRSDAGGLERELSESPSFAPHRNPSAKWAFRGEGVVVTFYSSGKCVIQGGGADAFAKAHLGQVSEDRPALERVDYDLVGTDESGKGDYFGPLVAAAVLVPKGQGAVLAELGVMDSKLVGDRSAHVLAEQIRAGYPSEVIVISPPRYNELYDSFGNLNLLLAWATATAIENVVSRHPCREVLSDRFGNERLIADALRKKNVDVHLVQKVRAESNPAVAAASLVARDAFLRGLQRLGREAGVRLPKGAGAPVLAAARKLVREQGREVLGRVAKLHFKTTKVVTEELF